MGCGCKKPKQSVPVQPAATIKINEVPTPIVTQPAVPSNNR